jgi:ABC-type multidrug transport system fused ATPase/permease subunit
MTESTAQTIAAFDGLRPRLERRLAALVSAVGNPSRIFGAGFGRRLRQAPVVRFLGYTRPHLGRALGAAAMGIAKFTLPLAYPLGFKYVVDVLLKPVANPDMIDRAIDRWCTALALMLGLGASAQARLAALTLGLLVIYIAQAVASYYRNFWGLTAGSGLIYDLRCAVYAHLQRLPHHFFDKTPSGAIFSRVVIDVDLAQEFVFSMLTNVWIDAVLLSVVSWFLFLLDRQLALMTLVVMPFYAAIIRYYAPRIKHTTHRLHEVLEVFSGDLQERIAGAATVKAFSREEQEIERFNQQTRVMYERTVEKIREASWQQGWTEFLTKLAPSLVVWAAGVMVMRGSVSLGTLVAFTGFMAFMYQPLERFAALSIVMASALAAIERIFSFLDLKPQIADHPLSRPLKVREGTVRFENVTFCYPGRDGAPGREALKEINLKIDGGSVVALVGRSGAGKTTLASLIPRFYDATSGRVLIDNRDVRHVTLKSLRENIGIVTQETHIFNGTVRELLAYAKSDASEDEMWAALAQANLADFVRRLPDGLDTRIGERGVKVSGGQRQRIALARVFLKNPPILILDEATSALDSEAENAVHEATLRLMRGRTCLLIAHRLRSAVGADQIVVLDQGRVVETGKHQTLLARAGVYARLFEEQARGLSLLAPQEDAPSAGARQAGADHRAPARPSLGDQALSFA